MKRLSGAVIMSVVLSCSYGAPVVVAGEMAGAKDLQGAKAIEAYVTGKFNFKLTKADGSTWPSLKSFGDLGAGVGNISTVDYAKKAAPVWSGNRFSVKAEGVNLVNDAVSTLITGTVSEDRTTLVEATLKRTIKGNGYVKNVEWTFKNITGGTLISDQFTNKKKVGYWKANIPLDKLSNHLMNVKYTETDSFGGETTFVSIPTLEEIQARYGGSSYIDSYKEVFVSFVFVIDL